MRSKDRNTLQFCIPIWDPESWMGSPLKARKAWAHAEAQHGPCKAPEWGALSLRPREPHLHPQEPRLLAHQLLHFPVFFFLELLNEAFKDRHLELYILGYLGRKREAWDACLPAPSWHHSCPLWCPCHGWEKLSFCTNPGFLKGRSQASFSSFRLVQSL